MLYCKIFNGLLPIDLSFKIYFPTFFDLEEGELKHTLKCFFKIHYIIGEHKKIKAEVERKKQERLNKFRRRRK